VAHSTEGRLGAVYIGARSGLIGVLGTYFEANVNVSCPTFLERQSPRPAA